MTLAFLTNGLGVFGLRVLSGEGVAESRALQYLALWYTAGLLLAAIVYFRQMRNPQAREAGMGSAMALCSLCGQLGMALALSAGLPGYVVFPVATGGGLVLVVLVGLAIFRERTHALGYLGIAVGVSALILLAFPE
jgi:multidrug transporter EmrE-like cation transporter